jgi:hypothetical protein
MGGVTWPTPTQVLQSMHLDVIACEVAARGLPHADARSAGLIVLTQV